ncbi:acyl-CoA dehydrogenase [Catenovulum sp. SM1970]|uniref:acyl-CoA dehydrogenase n=1 Tax=Marinifaba aquimaris TaxID=2741323 RepID=UPI0015729FCC|nr:acyl-CoA dehydrogenase [Marinifaba aquimaris]NTS76086.1 acyl-CoA dehydrogenase [Marinifaba aquimaris]
MVLLILILVTVAAILLVKSVRKTLITQPVFSLFKRLLPPLSTTEKEAMDAGDIWWDGELFSGKPNWQKLHGFQDATLSPEEQSFIDNELETLMAMLDDYQISLDRDLPKPVWEYIKSNGFFSMIIPKQYGGLAFSAAANSHIVTRIATKSLSAAVTVMVPNSLGPGELLMHYGTDEQKDKWLPGLASGEHIPCFALTGPEAGSDAGAIPDKGIVCKREVDGEEVLGISLTWNKRYITLAPVATVLGLAFKLYDPDNLLGDEKELGITCALIPADHPGVNIGDRHNPMHLAFMNGTTSGEDVFIPIDWIIGGPEYAGRGWRMLVECLSAGRGISLPALATALAHLSSRTTSAYSYVRKQFGLSIGRFEGVQEALARIGGNSYKLEATRKFTVSALDMGYSPSVVTAISKYHMTEIGRNVLNDAMDIHAGKAIQAGPNNYFSNTYMGVPIAITVEGANILTRNLMIFGQGATRCHPYVYKEMLAASEPDKEKGLEEFDSLLCKHARFTTGNFISSLFCGLTAGQFIESPIAGETAKYYKQLTRMSTAMALVTDMALLILGGALKRKEMLSARLGDVLGQLYMASAVLKRYETDGRQMADLPYVHYAMQESLHKAGVALDEFLQNFRPCWLARLLKFVIFPYGQPYQKPGDILSRKLCKSMLKPGISRERISYLCDLGSDEKPTAAGIVEKAFLAMLECRDIEKKIHAAQKSGQLPKRLPMDQLIDQALEKGFIDQSDADKIHHADELRKQAVAVDSFKASQFPQQAN